LIVKARRALAIMAAISVLLTGAGAVVGASPARAAAAATTPRTVVSLTFDDSDADQQTAVDTMNSLGLVGTFYTVSGWIGDPGYLTLPQLKAMKAAGQEIGGHTVTHPDLTAISAAEDVRQLCNNRATLTAWGFSVTSFAYPFSNLNAASEAAVKTCGYNSGRGLGDLETRFGCAGCGFAETIPSATPYDTAALDEVDSTWSLADLQNSVTNAEPAGGWVQLTFHHVCDNVCDPLSITPALFAQFTTWLANRTTTNNTVVQTVNQVVGGTVKPLVTAPSVPAAKAGVNGIVNPSLETAAADGSPQCWMAGGYGTNTPAFARTTPARTGLVGETLKLTNYVSGDAKILPTLDLGQCAPTVVAAHTYSLRAWYTSNAPTQFTVYLRNTIGTWMYWTASPWFNPNATFTQATWQTPAIPAGYTGLSFGLNLFSVGQLSTDDYALYDTVGAPALPVIAAPRAPAAGVNGLVNPGLETTDSGGAPLCWTAGGYGTNSAAFTTSAPGRSGALAETVTMSDYTSGDARLLPTMDAGTCSPTVTPGHTYSLRSWYTSTVPTQFEVYLRTTKGAWVYWTSSSWLAASASYTQGVWTTPAIPAGYTGISFGLTLFQVGQLTTDDYALYDTVGAPAA
jgi:peptidoglycan/xylan/chitin deacetylase (PgdA/CDA1 family)